MAKQLVTLVDGDCALCSGYARFVSAMDKRGGVYFETQQSETGQALLRRANMLMDLSTVVMLECGGGHVRGYTKSTAVLRTFRFLGMPLAVLYYLGVLVPRCVRDAVYGAVARNRHRLFGTNGGVCKLPDKVIRKRMGRSLPPELTGLEGVGGSGGGSGGDAS